ncbi:MAG: alanine racemase, partial [Proteobacteria bacterium]|nr:alanine racemase [Pseudomonadota bacterium]
MKLSDLDTPALILDRRRLEANLARMSERARALGVDLRPHMKTAKSAEVGRLATAGHSGGITVSTLKEAEYFAGHGFTDVVYAVGVSLDKLARVARLQAKGTRVTLLTDNLEVARGIERVQIGEGVEALVEDNAHTGPISCQGDQPDPVALAHQMHRGQVAILVDVPCVPPALGGRHELVHVDPARDAAAQSLRDVGMMAAREIVEKLVERYDRAAAYSVFVTGIQNQRETETLVLELSNLPGVRDARLIAREDDICEIALILTLDSRPTIAN